jgi:hypothetical protein
MFVVVADVDREDSFELPSVDDQDPVEALAAHGADPPFDEGVRAGCPYCSDSSRATRSRASKRKPKSGGEFVEGDGGVARFAEPEGASVAGGDELNQNSLAELLQIV